MKSKTVNTDRYGVTFTIFSGTKYTIGWWQIERDGLTHWISHLRDKLWFTKEMEEEFNSIIREHLESCYYR